MTSRSFAAAFALLLLLLPSHGRAGTLAPKKPSDVLTLRSSGAGCPFPGTRKLDSRVLPDGTLVPYTIPDGQVLVVTGAEWSLQDASPRQLGSVQLFLYTQTSSPSPVAFFTDGISTTDTGAYRTSVVPQAITRPTEGLCAGANVVEDTLLVVVHGFLAKDR